MMARGTERRALFVDPSYNRHFLDLLGSMSERYGVEVHAFVLMGNHYHLILRTPCGNCSQALQWLNVSFSAWFNAKRGRVGPVFQGRFRSTLIDGDGSWLLEASMYLHLNPVRVSQRGLGKSENRAEALGLVEPSREKTLERLKVLREYRWSSYRAYANYANGPSWLVTAELLRRSGGKTAYRNLVRQRVTRGADPKEFEIKAERIAVGSRQFLDRTRSLMGKPSKEQTGRSFAEKRMEFDQIVRIVERAKEEPWTSFRARYGDWGTALVLYLARRRSGLTLREMGGRAGGMDYKAVSARIRRFEQMLQSDAKLRKVVDLCVAQM